MRAILVSILSLAVLASCNQQEATTPSDADNDMPFAALTSTLDPAPTPAIPAWAASLIGQPLSNSFPNRSRDCIGWADALVRYDGQPSGAGIAGWAWNSDAKAAYPHLLIVDHGGVVRGAGESGLPRADVPQARPEVTDMNVGYTAVTNSADGAVGVYGVDDASKTACLIVGVRL